MSAPTVLGEHRFENGYGASVISYGYGARFGKLELAVLNADGRITGETGIGDNYGILGWLTEQDVLDTFEKIKALPPIERSST